jgi:hypothetical protein
MLERLCYSIAEVRAMTGFGRKQIFDDIDAGKLIARRRGRKWFIMKTDLLAWLEGKPLVKATDSEPAGDDAE